MAFRKLLGLQMSACGVWKRADCLPVLGVGGFGGGWRNEANLRVGRLDLWGCGDGLGVGLGGCSGLEALELAEGVMVPLGYGPGRSTLRVTAVFVCPELSLVV
jgi:hypothetical protein